MSDLPTLVFVPGAWHKPLCYSKIIKILEERHGVRCVAITLPSTAGDPEATFKDDLDTTRAAISNEITQGRNVIVIAHSYGGLVGNSAIKGFARPKQADPSETSPSGYVVGLVLIASGFTLNGLAFMDPFFGIPPPAWRVNKETGFADLVADPRQFFYHDVPEDEVEYWVSQLTPHSLKSLFEGGEHTYAGWMDVPAWYIGTIEDQGLPVVAQRLNVGMARSMGTTVEHRELQTSHSPFLSQPEEVVEILMDAVRSVSKKPTESEQTPEPRSKRIMIPSSRFWKPLTWFKFGLPLLFGHLIGKGILTFGWCRGLWRSVFR
ncbi:hypothetical protein H072_467 [Dactylellina haptotyla CBS 200.50]|uniref:AB hydrolase-1 domain-containing protein n=1 Tax=Dactylellina haptotyla (strain CBS 200.50) TaxID=1284197 RepID=S8ARS3_DACHA|nr:hypothetical protein H072_467 [Dactylellina haptotyla CBS 200.50]